MNSAARNRTLDTAKGIGILIICIYHLVFRPWGSPLDRFICGAVWLFLPLYFAIAGYHYVPGRRTLWQNIRRRFKTLLLPAVISSCVLLVLGGIYFKFTQFYTKSRWLRDAVHTFLRPELGEKIISGAGGPLFHNISPVWFVWTLWWATLLFYLVADFALKNAARFLLTTAVLLGAGTALYVKLPPMPWSINLAPIYAAMMLLGAFAAKTELLTRHTPRLPLALLEAALGLVAQSALFRRFGSDQIYAGQLGTAGVWDPLVCYAQLIVGGFALLQLCRLLSEVKLFAPLGWIGQHSLTFLLLHCMFGAVAAGILKAPLKTGGSWFLRDFTMEACLKSVAGLLISVALCTAVACIGDFLKRMKREKAAK